MSDLHELEMVYPGPADTLVGWGEIKPLLDGMSYAEVVKLSDAGDFADYIVIGSHPHWSASAVRSWLREHRPESASKPFVSGSKRPPPAATTLDDEDDEDEIEPLDAIFQ
jgi:hypothetical protein